MLTDIKPINVIYSASYWDSTRNKRLSLSRMILEFSINNNNVVGNRYFKNFRSNFNYILPNNYTILSANVQCKNSDSIFNVKIRKNMVASDLQNIYVNQVTNIQMNNLNIDVNAGDSIQVLYSSTTDQLTDFPTVSLEIAWRL